MYAIAGVSGHTGAATAEALLAKGQKIRVIVRDAAKGEPWKKRGAEVAVADMANPAALAAALKGAQGFYFLSPPNFAAAATAQGFIDDRMAFLDKVIDGVKQSGIKSVVFLSSIAAHHESGTGPIVIVSKAEKKLKGLAPSVTFIRASYFLENWTPMLPVVQKDGVLPNFGPVDMKFHQVSSRDIGNAAAEALMHPADGTRTVELAGKEDWSVNDVAQVMGTILGKTVTAVSAPVEGAKDGLVAAGVPPGMADLYAELYGAMGKGLMAFEKPNSIVRGSTSLDTALRMFVK